MDNFQEGGKSGGGKPQEDNPLGVSLLQKPPPSENVETIEAVATVRQDSGPKGI